MSGPLLKTSHDFRENWINSVRGTQVSRIVNGRVDRGRNENHWKPTVDSNDSLGLYDDTRLGGSILGYGESFQNHTSYSDGVNEDFAPVPIYNRQAYYRTFYPIRSRNTSLRRINSADFIAGIYELMSRVKKDPDTATQASHSVQGAESIRQEYALWRADFSSIALVRHKPDQNSENTREADLSHRQIAALLPFNRDNLSTGLDLEEHSMGHIVERSEYPVAQGAFGDVYEGKWRSGSETLKARVAIKVIRLNPNTQKEWKRIAKKLRREVLVWRSLRHENVLELLGTTSGFGSYPSLVSPWAENGNLNTYLENRGQGLPLSERLEILRGASTGLVYLHSRDVIHGDLSGANILIDRNGNALLSDFGLSIIVPEFLGTSYLASTIRGTLRWSAPEVYSEDYSQGKSTTTRFSDVYSLGSLILQTLSGKIPYYPKDDFQVIVAVYKGTRPVRPQEPEASMLNDMYWDFIQKCWAKTPEERPGPEQVRQFLSKELERLDQDIPSQKIPEHPSILDPMSVAEQAHRQLDSTQLDREAYQDPENYVVYSRGSPVDVGHILNQDDETEDPYGSEYRDVRHVSSQPSPSFSRTPSSAANSIESEPSLLQRNNAGLEAYSISSREIRMKRSYSAEFYPRGAYSLNSRELQADVGRHEETLPWRTNSRYVQRSLYDLPRESLQMATSYAITPEPERRNVEREDNAEFDQYSEMIHDLISRLGRTAPQRGRNTPHASPMSSRSIGFLKPCTSPAPLPRDQSIQPNDARSDRTCTHDHRPRDSRLTLRRGSWESVPVIREERDYQATFRRRSLPHLPHLSTDLISSSSSNNPSGRYLIVTPNASTAPEPTNTKGRPIRLSQICRQLKQHVRSIRVSVSKMFKGHSK